MVDLANGREVYSRVPPGPHVPRPNQPQARRGARMAASARIDELSSKFDDNPRRYCASLANEYRKAGDLTTAIAICRTQLRHFPSHMSGHVVLGQALFEAG